MKRALVRLAAGAFALVLAVLVVAASGALPIAASAGHWAVTRWFLELTMRRSVAVRALAVDVPTLDDPALVLRGAGHYELGCRPCHGAPDSAQAPIAAALTPRPPDLARTAPRFDDAELFYVVAHGIKMTGMPAWPAAEREDEVWAMVAFLRELPALEGTGYRALVHGPSEAAGAGADPADVALCARCHGADGRGRGGAFPALAGQRAEYLRASLRAYASGARHSGTMQSVAALLDEETMDALARHYSALAPPPAATPAPERIERGATLARLGVPARRVPSCADCHGPSSETPRAPYPRLAGQHADYLENQLRLFAEERRGGTAFAEIMREVAHGLTPDERRDVAAYYSALPGR